MFPGREPERFVGVDWRRDQANAECWTRGPQNLRRLASGCFERAESCAGTASMIPAPRECHGCHPSNIGYLREGCRYLANAGLNSNAQWIRYREAGPRDVITLNRFVKGKQSPFTIRAAEAESRAIFQKNNLAIGQAGADGNGP